MQHFEFERLTGTHLSWKAYAIVEQAYNASTMDKEAWLASDEGKTAIAIAKRLDAAQVGHRTTTPPYPSARQDMDWFDPRNEWITVTDLYGAPIQVRLLSDYEAKMLINREYGFETSAIKITGSCWYEATDCNHFEFEVKRWRYEADDFDQLKIVDGAEAD